MTCVCFSGSHTDPVEVLWQGASTALATACMRSERLAAPPLRGDEKSLDAALPPPAFTGVPASGVGGLPSDRSPAASP